MFLNQDDFEYNMMEIFKKLNKEYGHAVAHSFYLVIEMKMNLRKVDVHTYSEIEYQAKLEDAFSTLERVKITRIEKNSNDGKMLSAMK